MAKKKPTEAISSTEDELEDLLISPSISEEDELISQPDSLSGTTPQPASHESLSVEITTPTPISEDKMALTKRQERVKKALLQGCNNDAPTVVVNVENVLELLSLEACEENGLFPWVVDTQETEIKKRKPSSVVPANSLNRLTGRTEVDRAKLVELIESL